MAIIISRVNMSLNGVIFNYFLWPWLGSQNHILIGILFTETLHLLHECMSKAEAKLIHNDDDNNNNILNVHQTLNGELCGEKIV